MTLNEFRASRRIVPLSEAVADNAHIAESVDLEGDFTHCALYAGDCFILQSRRGFYLICDGDEYESRDLPALEFILWLWAFDTPETERLRVMIWA